MLIACAPSFRRGTTNAPLPPVVVVMVTMRASGVHVAEQCSRMRSHYNRATMTSTLIPTMNTIDEQLDYLAKGTVDLIERADLKTKMERGKPLTIKVGFDP